MPAPATRLHMLDFLAAIDQRNFKPIADIREGTCYPLLVAFWPIWPIGHRTARLI